MLAVDVDAWSWARDVSHRIELARAWIYLVPVRRQAQDGRWVARAQGADEDVPLGRRILHDLKDGARQRVARPCGVSSKRLSLALLSMV